MRWVAAVALGKIKDARAVDPLIAALRDSHPGVRSNAATALGEIGDLRAVKPLTAALEDSHPGVAHSASEALGSLRATGRVQPEQPPAAGYTLLDLAADIQATGGSVATFDAGGVQELSRGDIERQQQARKWEKIGDASFHKGDLPHALEAYQKALEIYPDEVLYMNLGSVYGSMGDLDHAIEYLERSLAINPGYERARANLEEVRRLRRS